MGKGRSCRGSRVPWEIEVRGERSGAVAVLEGGINKAREEGDVG